MATESARQNRLAAFDARMREGSLTLPKSDIAGFGAELDFPALPAAERLATPFACVLGALVTQILVRLCVEEGSTFCTASEDTAVRESKTGEEKRMVSPEIVIQDCVARTTDRLQIVEAICLEIGREQAKWDYMVDSQGSWLLTTFTFAIGPGKCKGLLSLPIRASIAAVTASPEWIIRARLIRHLQLKL